MHILFGPNLESMAEEAKDFGKGGKVQSGIDVFIDWLRKRRRQKLQNAHGNGKIPKLSIFFLKSCIRARTYLINSNER